MLVGQQSGTVVPMIGGMMPDHDYEDVPIEGEEERERSPPSHLTPPVESTYSIIVEEQQHLMERNMEEEGEYSHLGDDSSSTQESPQGFYDEVGVAGKEGRNRPRSTPTEEGYSLVTELPHEPVARGKREPPALPRIPSSSRRPHTTYGRGVGDRPVGEPGPASPSTLPGAGKDTVSKVKFNVIMEQLRKVQVCVGV